MGMFPENDRAEIAVKQIVLRALEEKKKELEPTMSFLLVEIDQVKTEIKRAEERLVQE